MLFSSQDDLKREKSQGQGRGGGGGGVQTVQWVPGPLWGQKAVAYSALSREKAAVYP